MKTWMVAYDIADPRRLQRVARLVRRYTVPVQYSVCVAPLPDDQLAALVEQLRATIDEQADDVRIYPIHPNPEPYVRGPALFPGGVYLHGDHTEILSLLALQDPSR